ncbi:MAG TPA: class I SAM-dependent methyltransferase [Cytophagaceae bacterium]|nr:class I SAM-dependent methyltransferase [Cytophagaceae bacterium]
MNKQFLISQYFRYLLRAKDAHSIHSPFVFDFYTTVIKSKRTNPIFEKIEFLRKELKHNFQKIEITDFGAGSKVAKSNLRTISSISRFSEKKPALAQLIFRIIENQVPKTILDLGTSLGITTLYEAKACLTANVYTFEGCPNTAGIATENFKKLSAKNITLVLGNIDHTLPELLSRIPTIDFAFFDANHRYQPTITYFTLCLEKVTEDTIFIFDDIYWSEEMKKAWEEIRGHSLVGISIDLFFIGIIFFRKKQPTQHFTLK